MENYKRMSSFIVFVCVGSPSFTHTAHSYGHYYLILYHKKKNSIMEYSVHDMTPLRDLVRWNRTVFMCADCTCRGDRVYRISFLVRFSFFSFAVCCGCVVAVAPDIGEAVWTILRK